MLLTPERYQGGPRRLCRLYRTGHKVEGGTLLAARAKSERQLQQSASTTIRIIRILRILRILRTLRTLRIIRITTVAIGVVATATMADWQRRKATSLKRRRTRHVPRAGWTGLLRRIAWPIGEERELRLWAEALEYTPISIALLGVLIGVIWLQTDAPKFPGDRAAREAAWGQGSDIATFLWEHFCGEVDKTKPNTVCTTYNWFPGLVAGVCAIAGATVCFIKRN